MSGSAEPHRAATADDHAVARSAAPGGWMQWPASEENVMPPRDELVEYLGELDVPLDQRRKAMRVVAAASVDADECGLLLDMLGLEPDRAATKPTAANR
jgi:hypothetical protein